MHCVCACSMNETYSLYQRNHTFAMCIQSLLYEATKMPRPVLLASLTQSVHQSPNFTFISVMHIGRQRKMFSFRGALYNLTFAACMCLWCHIEL